MNSVRQRPLSLGSLRAFEAVARRLSFSEAADQLHLTQSAVRRQIKGLEDQLLAPRARPPDGRVDRNERAVHLSLRYGAPRAAPERAKRLLGEVRPRVIGVRRAEPIRGGAAPPLATPADLAEHTLAEEDDHRPSAQYLSWRHWLTTQGQPHLEPRRWLFLNFTYQQVPAAAAGQCVALARGPLGSEHLARGGLI